MLTTWKGYWRNIIRVIIAEIFLEIPVSMRNDIFDLLKKHGYTLLNAGYLETRQTDGNKAGEHEEDMPKVGQTENIIAYKAIRLIFNFTNRRTIRSGPVYV